MAEVFSFRRRASRFTREPFATVEPLEANWLVKGLLPVVGLGFVVGPPGAGKSFAAIDLLASLASGRRVLGRAARHVAVAYVASEAADGVRKRIKAWRMVNGEGADLWLIPQPVDLRNEEDVADLAQALAEIDADLDGRVRLGVLAIDTVAASMPGANENDGADMSEMLSRLQRLAAELKLLILLVAHSGKDESRGIRGWSGQTGAADVILSLKRDEEDRDLRILTAAKVKEGEDGDRFAFRLAQVVLGEDADGEEITSATPVYETPPGARARKPRALNAAERIVLQAVRQVTDNGRLHPAPAVLGVPPGQKALARADVRARAVAGGFAIEGEKANTVTVRFSRALQGLAAKARIRIEGEWLWLLAET